MTELVSDIVKHYLTVERNARATASASAAAATLGKKDASSIASPATAGASDEKAGAAFAAVELEGEEAECMLHTRVRERLRENPAFAENDGANFPFREVMEDMFAVSFAAQTNTFVSLAWAMYVYPGAGSEKWVQPLTPPLFLSCSIVPQHLLRSRSGTACALHRASE
jgi:hypothetical protein